MSLRVSYIGDALTSTGFTLVGVTPYVTAVESVAVWDAVLQAREQSDLVILNREHAQCVKTRLEALISRRPTPPMVIVPSIDSDHAIQEPVINAARRVLGIS
jgi:vacuolar-type H+-ATPase subunit F/Vma7